MIIQSLSLISVIFHPNNMSDNSNNSNRFDSIPLTRQSHIAVIVGIAQFFLSLIFAMDTLIFQSSYQWQMVVFVITISLSSIGLILLGNKKIIDHEYFDVFLQDFIESEKKEE